MIYTKNKDTMIKLKTFHKHQLQESEPSANNGQQETTGISASDFLKRLCIDRITISCTIFGENKDDSSYNLPVTEESFSQDEYRFLYTFLAERFKKIGDSNSNKD